MVLFVSFFFLSQDCRYLFNIHILRIGEAFFRDKIPDWHTLSSISYVS